MKQAKKIFTRMLLNNWGGIDHQVIHFHEYVNLFSGKSGSGKSTVMDAMQMVLYGSVRNDFLNKAADDTKNKRSILSYLRGEQKDGSANRENRDFYAQVVLEIQDTASDTFVCVGAAFEVGRGDQELRKYGFFSHVGKFPEDEYLMEGNVPYSYERMKQFIGERSAAAENVSRINLNRIYPSQEAYINALSDTIFGYVDAGRFKTMEKSAIALRMTNGTGQFIKDYMFPKSREDTISAISDQLAAYREIREQVEMLETEIEMLSAVQEHDRALTGARADQAATQALLKILDIEDKKAHLEARQEDLSSLLQKADSYEKQGEALKADLKEKRERLSQVRAELKSSEFEKKRESLEQLNRLIEACANEASDWRALANRLKLWESEEGICDYVSNPTLHLLHDVTDGKISEEAAAKLKKGLKEAFDSIDEELAQYKDERRAAEREYREKKEFLEDLKSDKKHYRKELKDARSRLQAALSAEYGKTVHVEVLADLFDVVDEEWRDAIEGRLGRMKFALVVEPRYALDAAKLFREMRRKEFESIDLIDTAAILRDKPQAESKTLYDAVKTDLPHVDLCLKRYLGHIKKCETVDQLHQVRDGVTRDCYSYSSYVYRHLRQQDYKYQSIGRKISGKQIQDLEEELYQLNVSLIELGQQISTLNRVNDMERLSAYDAAKMQRLWEAGKKLKAYNKEADQLQEELRQLEQGTLIASLKEQEGELKKEIENFEALKDRIAASQMELARRKGKLEEEIGERTEALERLKEGFVPNPELARQAAAVIEAGKAASFKREKEELLKRLQDTEEKEAEARFCARTKFNAKFPSYGFGGMEKDNHLYDELLERCQNNFEPKFKAEFDRQYNLVYRMLRENVIATIHGEIRAAKRHRREINAMLAKIRFSDSIYQIDILPADDENRQFYEMLTAPELDMRASDSGLEGQISFGEDEFYQKYETQIRRLTDKFMPPREADQAARAAHKRDMEKYADYRTYLKFSMYEQAEDEKGNIRKNYVDDMAGRDSGGEGQNPKYVALLAGFAMLYMQQGSRDSKIRLVLLDEAFSKMDKERSEVCLHYARQLGLQLVVCVPDERLQSLIRNVDCVYAFRRANNRISMIHIDKGDYFKMVEGE